MTHRRIDAPGVVAFVLAAVLAATTCACGGRRPPASLDDCPTVCDTVESCSNLECEEISVCAQKC